MSIIQNRSWTRLKLVLLTMTCFLITACPESIYTTYKLDRKDASQTADGFYKCELGTLTQLEIKVGHFYNYDRKTYRGPLVLIKKKDDPRNAIQFLKKIQSANYGVLHLLDSIPDDVQRSFSINEMYVYGLSPLLHDQPNKPSRKAFDLVTIYTAQGKNFEFISK
ncbi:hypothetical protein [Nonlabens ponticola]|uniref:Lipoprotein n=1 Tax=Nonlabens ponticola TaxID=2496866 RepID=A0A3S9MXB6_9FLAO|nr:hypothetical protein [Nonlabens ponticola]AZQ43703.1 hypothetical protein EJ995_05470 [Nonlabens ponticola]